MGSKEREKCKGFITILNPALKKLVWKFSPEKFCLGQT
jgi:hypothetical protein